MHRLTIIYNDGFQEHYNVIAPEQGVNNLTGLKRYKEIIEDKMLKLVLENRQVVLIPIANVRKIISQSDNIDEQKIKEYPGFINVKIVDEA